MKRIEIIFESDESCGYKLSFSQSKANYSKEKLLEKLKEYEEEMLK